MSWTFRLANASDVAYVLAGSIAVWAIEGNPADSESEALEKQRVIAYIEAQSTTIAVADDDGSRIGFVALNDGHRRPFGAFNDASMATSEATCEPRYKWISVVLVEESWRGKGVGRALYAHATKVASSLPVFCDVYASNEPSFKFHERMGFHPIFEIWKGSGGGAETSRLLVEFDETNAEHLGALEAALASLNDGPWLPATLAQLKSISLKYDEQSKSSLAYRPNHKATPYGVNYGEYPFAFTMLEIGTDASRFPSKDTILCVTKYPTASPPPNFTPYVFIFQYLDQSTP